MAVWCAMSGANGMAVGCFCPRVVLLALRQEFGPDLECDGIDMLAGYGERTARTAAALGIPPDSRVVRDAARVERERGQRFEFRLRAGEGVIAKGRVDGGAVYAVYTGEADFPASVRDCFVAFLESSRQLPGGVPPRGHADGPGLQHRVPTCPSSRPVARLTSESKRPRSPERRSAGARSDPGLESRVGACPGERWRNRSIRS
jgi:hypothetical protein